MPAYDVAIVYQGLGDTLRALEWLDTAYQEHSGFVAWDPRFASLKNEPAFRDPVRRMALPEHRSDPAKPPQGLTALDTPISMSI